MTLSNAQRTTYKPIDTSDQEGDKPLLGRVFNIQRYSLNDGEGIRTAIFFKGCPLQCPWCSNPESRSLIEDKMTKHDSEEEIGKDMTIDEIMDVVSRDDIFFRTSGGGVTLSGGEILVQANFVIELLSEMKKLGYHTAIETTGYGNQTKLLKIGSLTDEILYDFKIMDAKQAKEVIGLNLDRVLDNFKALYKSGCHLIPRLPLIPGYTMNIANIDKILSFLAPYNLKELHILPFHQYGSGKYDSYGLDYAFRGIQQPKSSEVEAIKTYIESHGYHVVVGG